MTRVYIDIDIGDADAHARERAAYDLAVEYVRERGHVVGIDNAAEVSSLDDESRDLVRESFRSDRKWAERGVENLRFDAPPELRAGRVVIDLLTDVAPKTCENFRCLCTGERGLGKSSKKPLHYKGTRFHRIVSGFVMQGGDVVRNDGSGGESIYGGKFKDERAGLCVGHGARGAVAMANSGKNSNTSQFYVTLADDLGKKLDGAHVVFGRVVEGLSVVEEVGRRAASADGDPREAVVIADCGEVVA